MTGQLVVLGGCGAWPEAGRACSGFFVRYNGVRVVLDLGYATLPRLLALAPDAGLDAVVITHEHPDHCVDLHGLYRVRHFGERRPPLPLFAPPGVLTRLGALESDGGADALRKIFAETAMPGAEPAAIGPLRLSSVQLPHWVPNSGVRLATPGGVLAYTGDSAPTPAVAEVGRDADLFIVEATLQGDATSPYLMNARQAGALAATAGARRLLLTHFWPGSDRAVSVAEAAEHFSGEILVADEGLEITLS